MSSNKINLLGQQFGYWTVIAEAEPYRSPTTGKIKCAAWLCRCVCGTKKVILSRQLRNCSKGYSCGCAKKTKVRYDDKLDCMVGITGNGKEFLFDECDIDLVTSHAWCIDNYGYPTVKEKEKHFMFHREIMNAPKGMDVDHINGNRADNRRCNLRIVTRSQNMMNREWASKSGHRNVYWDSQAGKWCVCIIKERKKAFRKHFKDYDEACRIAEEKNKEIFGEYSIYNSRKGVI